MRGGVLAWSFVQAINPITGFKKKKPKVLQNSTTTQVYLYIVKRRHPPFVPCQYFFSFKYVLMLAGSNPYRIYSVSLFHHRKHYHSSSRLARWKQSTVQANMKKEVNSMNIAPVPIKPACLRIMGMATLPTADAPVRNLAASIQLQQNKKQSVKQVITCFTTPSAICTWRNIWQNF